MTETLILNAKIRGADEPKASQLLRSGQIPAILYGGANKNIPIALDAKIFNRESSKGGIKSRLAEIKIEGKSINALPYQIQRHPVTESIMHVDFLEVSKESQIKVAIKINILNEDKCVGVKKGGVINTSRRFVNVVCSPFAIPDALDVDVKNLQISDSVHIKDIALPDGAKAADRDDVTVLVISGKSSGDEDEAESQEEGEEQVAS